MRTSILIILILALIFLFAFVARADDAQKGVGGWQNVSSFSINDDEDHIVFTTVDKDGKTTAMESRKDGDEWLEAQPIEEINKMFATPIFGGLFMTFDERHIYFHASQGLPGSNFDIYRADYVQGRWTNIHEVEALNTMQDEKYPSITPGGGTAYFLRHQKLADERQDRKEADKMTIYKTDKIGGRWTEPTALVEDVSFAYVRDARISRDNLTLYYSVRSEAKEIAHPFYTQYIFGDNWKLPENMMPTVEKEEIYCPQMASKHFYYIQGAGRHKEYGTICYSEIPGEQFLPAPTVIERGEVLSKETRKPVNAKLEMHDPTSHDLLGLYSSSAEDGKYCVVNLKNRSYICEIRADGYSFVSYSLDYNDSSEVRMPATTELFDTIGICVNVFDKDLFRPVRGNAIATRQTDKATFRGVRGKDGNYNFRLPLGAEYEIAINAAKYKESSFLFRISGDIVSNDFVREMPIEHLKRSVAVKIYDSETNEYVSSSAEFHNRSCDEVIIKPENVDSVMLREGDKYDVTVMPPKGYSFKNFIMDLSKEPTTQMAVDVIPLREGTSLKLNNVLFDTNSANLNTESYAELDRLIALLNQNPDLMVEISAHSDNVGSAAVNMKVSELRAASVALYLVENGIDISRLSSKGYGFSQPVAPNDTEEHRALNRRVEFRVLQAVY